MLVAEEPPGPSEAGLHLAQAVLGREQLALHDRHLSEGSGESFLGGDGFLGAVVALGREDVEAFVDEYTGEGLSKEIAFDENGDVPQENVSYWAYKNEGGTLVPEVEVAP